MAAIDEGPVQTEPNAARAEERVPAFGRATSAVALLAIFALAVVSWWVLGDPEWSLVGARAESPEALATSSAVVSCVLFWVILAHIWTGFNFGTWPFTKLSQPIAGLLHVALNLVLGLVGTVLFTRGIGSWDPTFSPDAPGGAGYTAAAFVVLIGFYAYSLPSASLGNYPFDATPGPLSSVGVWLLAAFVTVVGVVALIYPNFNAQLVADAPISLPTVTGWVYSSIVIVILAAQLWDNAPWAVVTNRHLRALTAVVVTLGGGYLLMRVFKGLLHIILPTFVKESPGFPFALETAQLGVFVVLCALVVGLLFPTTRTTDVVMTRVIRTAIALVAGVLSYVFFMRFFATAVLHFPAVKGNYGGNPLLWADWMILILLWHSVAFGGHFATRRNRS